MGDTLDEYKQKMKRLIHLYYPNMDDNNLNTILDYSIKKRLYNSDKVSIDNSYTNKSYQMTLMQVSDYIKSRKPIATAFGTMFTYHENPNNPNPLCKVVDSFLTQRGQYKKEMFKYPKGSEQFEKYNLLQSLKKIDTNAVYGTLGMYTSLLYNINVATSITTQGREMVSTATMLFEMFLAGNVKFGSLDELMEFIDHIISETPDRKYNDFDVLDNVYAVAKEDLFAKLVLDCGYIWIPNDEELDIIWKTINHLSQYDINRIYYKNNLYEFAENSKVMNRVRNILHKLDRPLLTSSSVPDNVKDDLQEFCNLLFEYVYYGYMVIDRIDRCNNMIKSVTMISDTDSTIISVDAWYRFVSEHIKGESFRVAGYDGIPIDKIESIEDPIYFEEKKYDYNFRTDEIVELAHTTDPELITSYDSMRYTIINILVYCLDRMINEYMKKACINNNSVQIYDGKAYSRDCRIIMKNEFLMKRILMTTVKKNYASLMKVQEGELIPENAQLDVKGIECLTKSSKSITTRNALKKVLLEDILKPENIDQIKFIKDIAIVERRMINSLRSKSKAYYKPMTIKSASAYDMPERNQGIKASIAWNIIRPKELPAIDLEQRNAIDVAKVVINATTIESIKDIYPEIYENMKQALQTDTFMTKNSKTGKVTKSEITAIAIPIDVDVPEWLFDFIDYTTIIEDNISGFPYESIGLERMDKRNVAYTNILHI